MQSAIALGVIFVLGVGMYGLGFAARRWLGMPAGTWPMTVLLGLAVWITIGGALNLVRLAFPVTIFLLLLTSCLIAIRGLHVAKSNWGRIWARVCEQQVYMMVYTGVAVTIICFTAATQLSPRAFNHYDDYQKYFAHAVRLVQTGTLFGSPLNTLGSESLGGQAFLQEPFVALLPMAYINAADAVFCFSLIILMVGGIALHRPAIAPVAILAMLMVWLFEPQYVSVTAVYSAAALIFGLVVLSLDSREFSENSATAPPSAAIGLVYAALVALKPTFALFCLLHFLLCGAAELFATRKIATSAKHSVATAISGILFISPWVALYGPYYWLAVESPARGLSQAPTPAPESLNLLATSTLFYGGSYVEYTFVALMLLVCGGFIAARQKSGDPAAARYVAICLTVPLTYCLMVAVIGPLLAGYDTALRHVLPVLIGAAPSLLVLCGLVMPHSAELGTQPYRTALVCACLAGVVVIWFAPDAWQRARSLIQSGTMLAYLQNWPEEGSNLLFAASHEMLDGTMQQRLNALQSRIPEGDPLLVWISAPFLLNFARNPIIDVDIGGTATPWSKTPAVSYILWQYGGFAVRQPRDYAAQISGPGQRETYLGARGFAYASRLQDLLARSQIANNYASTGVQTIRAIYNDGKIVLLEIGQDVGFDADPK
jgi:hypothetical protein